MEDFNMGKCEVDCPSCKRTNNVDCKSTVLHCSGCGEKCRLVECFMCYELRTIDDIYESDDEAERFFCTEACYDKRLGR